ncbi:MAG TPA: TonB-dependent receptor [Flavisolibacter sp.]|nr:TonB-dependent receptor [Flavisolibacter sp.]
MKKALWLSFLLTHALLCLGQDTLLSKGLDEVIIHSGRFAEKRKNVVQRIEVISAQRIAQINAQNTGDLLINSGNVFVQKSQQGGSSPVIRGFEASRVLLVIDGIRMNNAIYRAGHLQNVITVDQNMLESVEVLYGPASTLYGSDALGGVIHFRTKQPRLSMADTALFKASAFARYSSANNEKTVHADLNTGWKRFAWLQSYNFSDFDDMKMGSNYPDKYPDFGRRSQYIASIDGKDSIIVNPDDRVQRFSGYRQWDITQKLLFQQNDRVRHLLNLQYSSSSDIPRYDRLQDTRNGALRFAEWYYGPQRRQMAAYELNISRLAFLDEFRAIASYQHIEESRHQREYRRYDRQDHRLEDLDVISFTADGRMFRKAHELTIGADIQLNYLQSEAFRRNMLTGSETKLDSRYPNGDNRMSYTGLYAQHLLKLKGGKLVLNDGVRVQYNSLRSTIADNSFFQLPFTSIEQDNLAFTANLGLAYMPSGALRFSAGLATGFRSPNIDDLARIFESNSASRQLIVPNPDIEPEYTYNADLAASVMIGKILRLEASGFYTWFRNAIALSPFQLNGQDSVVYNGSTSRVYANRNANRAFVYGFHTAAHLALGAFSFNSTISYTYGRLKPLQAATVPLDHIPPVYGRTGARYDHKLFSLEAYALYNGWKRIKDYNPSGEDNAQYATPDGTPAWHTLNARLDLRPYRGITVQLGIENMLDRNYRYFASGFSAAGRNWILALRADL